MKELEFLRSVGFIRSPRFDHQNYECYIFGNFLAFYNISDLAKGYVQLYAYPDRYAIKSFKSHCIPEGYSEYTDQYELDAAKKFLNNNADRDTINSWNGGLL